MTKTTWMILETADSAYALARSAKQVDWFELSSSQGDHEPSSSNADQISEALSKNGYRKGQPVVFAFSSASVIAAQVECDRKSVRKNRSVLAFELEEFSPVAAEDIVVDAIFDGQRAFGCLVEVRRYRELFAELAELGVKIVGACPATLLAVEQLKRDKRISNAALCLYSEQEAEIVTVHGGHVRSWTRLSSSPSTLRREFKHLGSGLQRNLVSNRTPDLDISWDETYVVEPRELAVQLANSVASGRVDPPVDLYRDPLTSDSGKKSGVTTLIAASLLLIAFVAAGHIQAWRYQQLANQLRADQKTIYKKLYPGEKVPVGIQRRLEAKAKELKGTKGEDSPRVETPDALALLYHAIKSLPYDANHSDDTPRFHLSTVDVQRSGIELNGLVREHEHAFTLESKFKEAGFTVEPQKTENRGDGVSLNLFAKLGDEIAAKSKEAKQ